MTVTSLTHLVVKDVPPPAHVMTIGRLYPIGPDIAPKAQAPEFTSDEAEAVSDEPEALEEKNIDEAETKVVRRGRRPKPEANEDVSTK